MTGIGQYNIEFIYMMVLINMMKNDLYSSVFGICVHQHKKRVDLYINKKEVYRKRGKKTLKKKIK